MTSLPPRDLSPADIRREGWAALTERLGVAGAMRFLMEYDPGRGDYTRERGPLFADLTLEDATRSIRLMASASAPPPPGRRSRLARRRRKSRA